MKKLLALLTTPFIAGVTACAPKEPVKEDYFTGEAPLKIWRYAATIKDFDKDGWADAIMDAENHALFYAEGYEKEARITEKSMKMTPALRLDASMFIKADNSLRYNAEKADYERVKSHQDTTGEKK